MRGLVGASVGLMGAVLVGCHAPTDPQFVSSSSNLTSASDGAIYVADADNGTLVKVGKGVAPQAYPAGIEPTRVVRIGDRVYVTLRGERAIAVYEETADGLKLVGKFPVGAEPVGIVASPDGQHLYVAVSGQDQILELDAETMDITRVFSVPNQPRWVAMHPDGNSIYIGCAMEGGVYRIDLQEGTVERVELPTMPKGDPNTGEQADLVPRITGDPAVAPDGSALVVPGLYVDNDSSVGPADPVPGTNSPDQPPVVSGGYAGGNFEGMTRFNPAVISIPLENGKPTGEGAQAILVSGRGLTPTAAVAFDADVAGAPAMDRMDTGFAQNFDTGAVRGYLSHLSFAPDGHTVVASIEGANHVAIVPARAVQAGRPIDLGDLSDPFFGFGNFSQAPIVFVRVPAGPQGVSFAADGSLYAYSFLDRQVVSVDHRAATTDLEAHILEGGFATLVGSYQEVAALEPSILAPDVQQGRRMFLSAELPQMTSAGAGVSCATCHFEGRNDGLTWTFDHGVRQTPSLAGRVSLTSPVTWTNDVGSVAEEAFITSQGRMGGAGISTAQTRDIAAFIDFTRDFDNPLRGVEDPAIVRGRAIFERADTACATCHDGERYTGNEAFAMNGLAAVNTPGLVGLAVTAPYLHDGSAATLTDLIESADRIGMGRTSQLTAQEKADLEQFLRSL